MTRPDPEHGTTPPQRGPAQPDPGLAAPDSGLAALDPWRLERFETAARFVHQLVPPTPLVPSPELSGHLGRAVYLKLENLQQTGSFKVRGAAAYLSALAPAQARRGVVTCSSGNHGRAVAFVAGRLGIRAAVFVPEWVDPIKLAAIRSSGADTHLVSGSYDDAEAAAWHFARAEGRCFISPFDDPWVIAGQGSLCFELLQQLAVASGTLSGSGPRAGERVLADASVPAPSGPAAFDVALALSGGGLAGGVAAAGRALGAKLRVIGVSAANADVMLRSLEAGRPIEHPEVPTLAGALAGGIGMENRHTFDLVRRLVTAHERVDERQIAQAIRYALERLHLRVEGGGAVALAAVLARSPALADAPGERSTETSPRPLVVVLSGGNVDGAVIARLMNEPDFSPPDLSPPDPEAPDLSAPAR